MCSWNWGIFKIVDKEVLNLDLEKTMDSPVSFSEASENVFLFLFHGLFPLKYVFTCISLMQLYEKWNF